MTGDSRDKPAGEERRRRGRREPAVIDPKAESVAVGPAAAPAPSGDEAVGPGPQGTNLHGEAPAAGAAPASPEHPAQSEGVTAAEAEPAVSESAFRPTSAEGLSALD